MGKQLDLIVGARPNFMKAAAVIQALERAAARGGPLCYRLVHTGQHYDRRLSDTFFEQLGIPEPELNLGAGSGTQAEQTAKMMLGYERVLMDRPCDLCVVFGDVTSTMACAIVAKKLLIRVAHVEGGIRSGDLTMPEEINRIVTDSITDYFFTTSETANENLRGYGVPPQRVFFVGNTMIDTLLRHRPRFSAPEAWTALGLQPRQYLVVTLHRPANVDDPAALARLLAAIIDHARGLPVVFPVHPRTLKVLASLNRDWPGLHSLPPLGYLQFNYLVMHARAVITDSGGITEETTVMGVPCLTIRDNTERPETISMGTNELVGTDPARLGPYMERLFDGKWKPHRVPPLWDGKASERIVAHLERILAV